MKGKHIKLCCLGSAMAFSLIGCGNEAAQQNSQKEPETAENRIDNVELVVPDSSIQELENGLSLVKFEGNDGFSVFLENGGALSDGEVVQYLTDSMLSGAGGLIFNGTPFGCSTISTMNDNGEALFGRNFDWYNCQGLIVTSYPENAYASISTVNTDFISQGAGGMPDNILTIAALYAPLDGMNEEGLAVSVNMIEDSVTIEQNTDKPDITTTTAVRMLLNQAADVEEAIQLLEDYDLHASFGYMIHFALSDVKGNSAVVEYVNNEMVVTETPVVTNFYLSEGEKNGIGTSQSHIRYDVLMEVLSQKETMSEEDVRDALDSVSKHNYNDGETTEWSAVFNQSTGEAVYYHRENFNQAYRIQLKK